jgi:hypothetical protein
MSGWYLGLGHDVTPEQMPPRIQSCLLRRVSPVTLGRVYGLGLRFAPNERVDLRAEMQRFTRVGADSSTDASTMLFGARVRF